MRQSEAETPSSILDFEAVGRVLAKVRAADQTLGDGLLLPAGSAPDEWERVRLARADLSNSISWAYTLRDVHGDWTSDSRARRRYEAILRVRRLSRDLVGLIEDDQLSLAQSFAPYFPTKDEHGFVAVDFSQFVTALAHLQGACAQERDRLKVMGSHQKAALSQGDRPASLSTPGNTFITRMAKAFEEAFRQAPSIKFTSERAPTGPFVQFVEAVTSEMGEPMNPNGIRKAWDRANATGQKPREI